MSDEYSEIQSKRQSIAETVKSIAFAVDPVQPKLTTTDYLAYRLNNKLTQDGEYEMPTLAELTRLFGSFSEVCRAADVQMQRYEAIARPDEPISNEDLKMLDLEERSQKERGVILAVAALLAAVFSILIGRGIKQLFNR